MNVKKLLFLAPEEPEPEERVGATDEEIADIAASLGASRLDIEPFPLHRSGNGVLTTAPEVWRAFKESGADGLLLSPRYLMLVEQAIIMMENPVFLLGANPKENPVRRIFLEVREFVIPEPSKYFPVGPMFRVANFRKRGSLAGEEISFLQAKLREAKRGTTRLNVDELGGAPKNPEEWATRCKGVNALLMNPEQLINAYKGLILPRARGQHVFVAPQGKYCEFRISSEVLPRAS